MRFIVSRFRWALQDLQCEISPGSPCGISPLRHSGYRLVFSGWKNKRYKLASSRCSSGGETDARVATPWHVHVARRPRRIIRRAWSVFSRSVSRSRAMTFRRRCRRPALLFSSSSSVLLPSFSLSLSVTFLNELRDRQGARNPLEISAFVAHAESGHTGTCINLSQRLWKGDGRGLGGELIETHFAKPNLSPLMNRN